MPFNPFTIDLPVREIIPAVREHLAAQNTLIENAPPVAGKSTLLPLALLDEDWLKDHHIAMEVSRNSIQHDMLYNTCNLTSDSP